jgi:glycosyltransferase involved in cell wall biosynthesis
MAVLSSLSRSLHIAIISRRIVRTDGQGRVNAEIIMHAVQQGMQFTLVAEAVSPELIDLPGVNWVKIDVRSTPTQFLKNLAFAIKTAPWLRLNRGQFDIVHVDGFVTFGRSDVNVVHYVHSEWLRVGARMLWADAFKGKRGLYQLVFTLINAWLERSAFRQATCLVAVSGSVKQQLVRLGVPAKNIFVVPNGVDAPSPPPVAIERSTLSIPDEVFLLLFAGDLQTARKNLDTLLRALALVPDVHLAVAGDVRSNRYPVMAKALGLGQRVHFISFRKDDLAEVMAAADVFVMISLYEPFGLVVLEAMAAGTAVISSSSVGASSLIGKAGVVLPRATDHVALANVIRELCANRARTAQMGRYGRETALACTWDHMANEYVRIYESI